jgi:hypothetical protein
MPTPRTDVYLWFLGRGLAVGGLIGAALSAAPGLLIWLFAPGLDFGMLGIVAAMLLLGVAPMCLIGASAGAILLAVGLYRRRRYGP